MSFSALVSFAQTMYCVVVALSLRVFLKQYDRTYIRRWAVGWAGLAVFYGVLSVSPLVLDLPQSNPVRFGWSLLYITAGFIGSLWILIGMYELARQVVLPRRTVNLLTAVFAIGSPLMVVGTVFTGPGPRYGLRVGLRALLMGGAFLWMCVALARRGFGREHRGNRLVLLMFVFFGLLELHDVGVMIASVVFDLGPPSYWVYQGILDFLGIAMMSTGSLLWLLEDEWSRAATVDKARAESDAKYRVIFDNSPVGIGRSTLEGEVLEANHQAAQLLGFPSVEQLQSEFTAHDMYADPRDRDRLLALLQRDGRVDGFEVLVRRRDGSERWIRLMSRLNRGEGHMDVAFSDITREREAEQKEARLREQLHQSQKMEAIGQLTGGIAHDFNNLLMVVLGNLGLIAEDADNPEVVRELSASAVKAAEGAAGLTQRLLAFSRKQPLRPRSVDLPQLIDGMKDLLTRSLGETVEIELVTSREVRPCLVDPGRLKSAVLNLAINARDAMATGGRLTIEAVDERLDADPSREVEGGDYAVVVVSDTGVGMSPDVVKQALEPFFTTKDVGEGSGLGLSMVYGFVKQSAGDLRIHSEVGKGTEVRIYLPTAGAAPLEAVPKRSATGPLKGDGEIVLVVEDDEAVLEVTMRYLVRLNYEVVPVTRAAAAMTSICS